MQVVNDEPEDGPTFYFYLVDLVTPVILRDFLELGQGVDALFRVRDPNVESRASTRLLALKEAAMKQTSMDSLWNQVSWREITVTGAREGREVFDVLAKSCYAVLDEARAYDKFYHNSNLIRIPANANRDNTIRDYPGYAAMLDGYETDAVVSVEMIVDAMLDQVQKSPSSMAADAGNVTTTEASESDAVMGHLQAYFDRTIAHFSNADTTAEELLKSNANNRAAAFVVQHGDSAARKVGRYELSPLKIDQGLSTVGEMAQCSRVAKIQQSQAFKNLVANRAKDMLASKAQLYWVSKVPVPQLDRAVLQLEFERMLQQKYAGVQWSLDDYCWTEALTADTMAQVGGWRESYNFAHVPFAHVLLSLSAILRFFKMPRFFCLRCTCSSLLMRDSCWSLSPPMAISTRSRPRRCLRISLLPRTHLANSPRTCPVSWHSPRTVTKSPHTCTYWATV